MAHASELIAAAERALGRRGRLIVRYSGTEPVLRLCVEHPDGETAKVVLDALVTALRDKTAGWLTD